VVWGLRAGWGLAKEVWMRQFFRVSAKALQQHNLQAAAATAAAAAAVTGRRQSKPHLAAAPGCSPAVRASELANLLWGLGRLRGGSLPEPWLQQLLLAVEGQLPSFAAPSS